MTDDDLKEFLVANRDQINAQVRQKLIDGLIATHRWEMSEQISKTVNEFVAAEIIPGVKAYLQAEKGAIMEASLEAAREIGDMISKEMVKKAAQNIAGYSFRAIMEGVFK